MTREEAKRRAELYSALADGKTIQWKHPTKGEWLYINIGEFNSFCETIKYRIKPEPNYRPFKTPEECWHEMHKHHDFGWVKDHNTGHLCQINCFCYGNIGIDCDDPISFRCAFDNYLFPDGTPFGIKEEQI